MLKSGGPTVRDVVALMEACVAESSLLQFPSRRNAYMDNRVEGPFRTMQRVSSQDAMGGNQSFRPHGRAAPGGPARLVKIM